MAHQQTAVIEHYGQADLANKIISALKATGKNINNLARSDLNMFDEFHIRGLEATKELAALANLKSKMKVLDLGSGIGGPARFLADEYDCQVIGLDIVSTYCQTAVLLTEMTGLSGNISFCQGDGIALPFKDSVFDTVWSQHMTMNIADKNELFQEIYRVLGNGGKYILYEICEGTSPVKYYPVPWARDASINHQISSEEMRRLLISCGFKILDWRDVSSLSLKWLQEQRENKRHMKSTSALSLDLRMLMGKTMPQKIQNLIRNLAECKIGVIQGILQKEVLD